MKIDCSKWSAALFGFLVLGLANSAGQSGGSAGVKAFVGAHVIDGSGKPPIEKATILVRDGKIEAVGASVRVPAGAQTVNVAGKTIIPGLVNAHGHFSIQGGGPDASNTENLARQLALYARHGITTVWSLGGEGEAAVKARDSQDTPALSRARIYFAGPVIVGKTPEEARQMVAKVAAMRPDVIKIRVDDNLGASQKMAPEVYRAVIDEAHRRGLRLASHMFYLEDAKSLLRAGSDFIAHSVRDKDVDDEFVSLLKQRDVCYCPTFTREISTFIYESTPAFFKDPFFVREADRGLMKELQDPERQAAMKNSKSAQAYKAGLEVARRNLKKISDAGVRIAMGTDTGAAPGRFQGYFEHLELEMMQEAGMTPQQVLRAATGDAATCMQRADRIGTLQPGKWADFLVLDKNPLEDVRNTKSIASVWIAGNQVQR
jgi:imidazolonepropionase-like amidohydrolase